MSSLAEFNKGMTNTNAHVFKWIKNRKDVDRIMFVDFNQFNPLTKLKYLIKNQIYLKNENTISKSINYRLDKISDKIFHFLGTNYLSIESIVKKLNWSNLEVWSFNPFDTNFLEFKDAIKIFYTIDDWRKNKLFTGQKEKLDRNYKIIAQKADYILYNGKRLKNDLWNNIDKAYWTPNGVEVEYFKNPGNSPEPSKNKIDEILNNSSGPVIGYLGVITPDRVDFELLEYVIKNNQDKFFVLAGPVWQGFDSSYLNNKYKNIIFTGMMYYPDKPYLFSKFDVCLIPHKISDFIQSMDPIKLYDYLAAGKPIVSTKVIGTQQFSHLVYCAENKKEFSNMIGKALKEDSEDLKKQRIEVVQPHSWKNRFLKIEKILGITQNA